MPREEKKSSSKPSRNNKSDIDLHSPKTVHTRFSLALDFYSEPLFFGVKVHWKKKGFDLLYPRQQYKVKNLSRRYAHVVVGRVCVSVDSEIIIENMPQNDAALERTEPFGTVQKLSFV